MCHTAMISTIYLKNIVSGEAISVIDHSFDLIITCGAAAWTIISKDEEQRITDIMIILGNKSINGAYTADYR